MTEPDPGLASAAAEAFLIGWATTGAPLSDRFTTRATAAINTATEHATSPHVLEVTLHLGKLEGTWALVYDRREKLIRKHTRKVLKAWRAAAKPLDAAGMVRSFRHHAGLTLEATHRDPWREALRAEAVAAAAGYLAGIYTRAEYKNLVATVEAALAASEAEGKTAALAIAAEEAGAEGFNWASAYAHMYKPLLQLEDLPGMADTWVTELVGGAASDVGRTLASLAANGGTYEQMVTAVTRLVTGPNVRSVQVLIDYAMSGSANTGALNLYASEGVSTYNVLTAADNRVCPLCEEYEAGNPHELTPGGQPLVPGHPLCRCTVAPGKPLPHQVFAQFLTAAAA